MERSPRSVQPDPRLPDYAGIIGLAGVVGLVSTVTDKVIRHRKADPSAGWFRVIVEAMDDSVQVVASAGSELYKRYLEIVYRAGWWAIPGLIPNANLHILFKGLAADRAEAKEADLNRRVSQFFTWLFGADDCKRLAEVVSSWQDIPELESAWPVINSALVAHRSGHYHLSVASLLPVIEHLLRAMSLRKRGNMNKVIKQGVKKRLLAELEQHDPHNIVAFCDRLLRLYTNKDRELDRHEILHGTTFDYGTETNSLKCFLLIHSLVDICRLLAGEPPQYPSLMPLVDGVKKTE